jgi:hypothetical protein
MLHHVSLNAHNPEKTASALAEMLAAKRFMAPSPPFPANSWLICMGDDQGTLIELMPWGAVRDPTHPAGLSNDPGMCAYSGSHILLTSPRPPAVLLEIAGREKWHAEPGSAGLFKFTKVWIENAFLLEIMTPAQAEEYKTAFNHEGLAMLDGRLRQIESALASRQ